MNSPDTTGHLRNLLCELGHSIRAAVIRGREHKDPEFLAAVAAESAADTIYEIDRLSEEAIFSWFASHWPSSEPVELVMEGVDETYPPCFPEGTPVETTKWKCILDPIDGTRGIMYDKRPAWTLAGLAPQLGTATSLSDITVGVMTELPTTRHWRSDQISAIVGRGIRAETFNVIDGTTKPAVFQPSTAHDFHHGFSTLVKFFPEGKTLTAQIEELLWDRLAGTGPSSTSLIFDDQYISTGGQFHELLAGHDRMIADLRPLILARLEIESALVCHPYDVCAWPVLTEAGVIYEGPDGHFPDAPLDTTSPVSWIGYANPRLAGLARPVLQDVLQQALS